MHAVRRLSPRVLIELLEWLAPLLAVSLRAVPHAYRTMPASEGDAVVVALVTLAGSPFTIVRTGATTFLALPPVCPHQASIVNTTSNGFLCPNHGAQFSSTGTWVDGQRTTSLRSYTTTYDPTTDTLTVA